MQHKNQRNLSVQIPEIIIKDDDMFADYAFYYCLHYIQTGGVTLNYRKKYKELSQRIGVCENTVRKYIGRCVQRGWMWRTEKNLHTLSQNKIKQLLGLEDVKYKEFTLMSHNFDIVKQVLRAKIIESNLTRQVYRVKQKEFSLVAKKFFGKALQPELSKEQIKTVRKQIKYYSAKDKMLLRKESYEYTVSKRKVASLINRKCASTGSRYLKKASQFFKTEKRTEILVTNSDRRYFENFNLNYKGKGKLFYYNGNIFERKCDLVSFNYLNEITKLGLKNVA